jgi:hypothetical protein
MKTNLLLIVALLLVSGINHLQAQQTIHSTQYGGLWPENTTWIEAVPSAGDSVVLQGPASMLSYTGWCTSLNITSDGSLGGNGGQGTLYIYGSMYNNGAILGSMNYNLQGNLVNNKPWNGVDNHLLFTGMNHNISCAAGASINALLEASDSLHNFSLLSDVTLNTSYASNFGFSQLDAGIHKLTVTGGQFNNCRVHALDTLQFDSYVSSLNLSGDYKLTGNMICYYNMSFYDKATNYGTIQFASGVGGDPLKLRGDFINEGTLNHDWVQVEKNIVNHGIWSCFRTEFTGAGDKHISHSAGHPFGGGDQFMSDNSGSKIFLDSDVELTVPTFHLNNNTLNCGNHLLTANTTFFDGTLQSESEIAGNNDFWTSTFTGDFKLTGNNRFSNCTLNGNIENTGMMTDITFYGGIFKSYGHLVNMDTIEGLNMNIYGDLTNQGMIYNNALVNITGNTRQYILLTQAIEAQTKFYSDIAGTQYQWMHNGEDIPNQIYDILQFGSLQLSDAGIYQCRVVTTNGTEFSREIVVNNITSLPRLEPSVISLNVYPNPFAQNSTIVYQLASASRVLISVLDSRGVELTNLLDSYQDKGVHKITIDGSMLKKGMLFLRLEVVTNGKKQVSFLKLNHI